MIAEKVIQKLKNIITGSTTSFLTRIIHGLSWTMLGTGSQQIAGLFIGIFISNYLGLTEFGKYGIIVSTLGMLGMFAGIAMGYTVTKFVAEYRIADPDKSGRYIGMTFLVCWISSVLVSSILFIFSAFMAGLLFDNTNLSNLLKLAAPILALTSLNAVARAGFVGLELFKPLAIIDSSCSFLRILMMIVGAILFKIYGVVGGWVVSETITFIVLQTLLRKKCIESGFSISYGGSRVEWKVLWNFTYPNFLSNVIMNPANWACNVLIVNLPNGLYYMGILTAARQVQRAVAFIPMRLMKVTLPAMSNLFGNNDTARFYKLAFYTQASIFGIAIIVSLPLMIFSKFILSFYGKEFMGESLVLITMLGFGICYILEISLSEVLLSQGKSLKKFYIFSGVTLFSLALFWLVFLQYGAIGYALSMLIAHFAGMTILLINLIVNRSRDLNLMTSKDDL